MTLPFSSSSKPMETPTPCVGVLNIDWLSFSVRLHESAAERDKHEFIFNPLSGIKVVEFQGTQVYRRRFIFYDAAGRKLLTFLCCPHSRVINHLSALVEVANSWLYVGFEWVFNVLQDFHPCSFLCMSRIDICCDFELHDNQRQLIQDFAANRAYVQGKREGAAFFTYSGERVGIERVPKQLSWGSKNSNIRWKIYNKTLEIFEPTKNGGLVCSKPYIVTQWEDAGFDTMNVWRVEVSIMPAYKFEWHGKRITYNDVLNTFLPMDLFVGLYSTRFVQRMNDHHADRSNDRRVHILGDFGQTDRFRQYVNPDPNALPVIEYAACLNAAMTQLSKPEVQANAKMKDVWIKTAEETIINGNLQGYFQKAYGYDFKHIRERINEPAVLKP